MVETQIVVLLNKFEILESDLPLHVRQNSTASVNKRDSSSANSIMRFVVSCVKVSCYRQVRRDFISGVAWYKGFRDSGSV